MRRNSSLSNRAGEISIAFTAAAKNFLKDSKTSYDDIQRVKFSIRVDQEQPDVTYPLSATTQRPDKAQFFKEMEGHILYFLLFHNMSWSTSSVVHAELRMDDKTSRMTKPNKSLDLTLEGS